MVIVKRRDKNLLGQHIHFVDNPVGDADGLCSGSTSLPSRFLQKQNTGTNTRAGPNLHTITRRMSVCVALSLRSVNETWGLGNAEYGRNETYVLFGKYIIIVR